MEGTTAALLAGSAVLVAAVTAVRVSARLGLPTLLVYLALGMLLGEAGVGVRFDDARLPPRSAVTLVVRTVSRSCPTGGRGCGPATTCS